ncbi:EAL and HDOD domain-containing protein [Geobacter sp. AOG2]|uniref:EAL and HDOD domain-containing protein n=1 Tax=Geobacter sp. AOG2 TaxID=1566347 RepID=UPI001CC55A8E|nr:HDOD domain-containing protein [Geobacter sp. AOG2]GFE60580.1 cyclic diguanylate phosphodiesterase [Geobacter sp. AOG2]
MRDDAYLIGRQPILTALEEITAFELLFRSPESFSSAQFDSATQASTRVMFNTVSSVGVSKLLGNQQGFINVDTELLMSDIIELLPHQQVGLELLESIKITPEIVERCRTLKSLGYQLALDDHEYSLAYEPLYNGLVDIIKIDLFTTPLSSLRDVVEKFRAYPVKLLAEKVDSRDVFLRCRSMGIELFQGYFFARPALIKKQRLANTVTSFLKLMQQLVNDAEITDLETTFKESPVLVYKLLILVNSVSFGLQEKIRTIRHALSIIGRQQLSRWVQIALFAEDGREELTNPIMDMAVTRATFMEELARVSPRVGGCSTDEAFMAGTLSMLIDVYDIPLDEVATGLSLSDDIRQALDGSKGEIGDLLSLAKLIERNNLDEAIERFEELGISLSVAHECQQRAFNWHGGLKT